MVKRYALLVLVLVNATMNADQPLVQRLRQTGKEYKIHPQLLRTLETILPQEKIAVWIQLRDRPRYEFNELPARGFLPPVNEQYVQTARTIPGAQFLGVSELTNEVSLLMPASSIPLAVSFPFFDRIEESPPRQREGTRSVASHPAYSAYQTVSYDAMQTRPLQEATWGGYAWDTTGVNRPRKIAVFDEGIWPYHPAFWTSEKLLPTSFGDTTHSLPISIAARANWVHLLPKRSDNTEKLYYMRSSNYGVEWDTAREIAAVGEFEVIADYAIGAAENSVVAVYVRLGFGTSGAEKSVHVVVSNDNGATWTSPLQLYVTPPSTATFTASIRHVGVAVTTDAGTVWAHAVWAEESMTFDLVTGAFTSQGDAKVRRSNALGTNTWMATQTIYTEVKPPFCIDMSCTSYEYRFFGLDASAEGATAHVVFHRIFRRGDAADNESRLFLYTSLDDGSTWGQSLAILRNTTDPPKADYPAVCTKDGFGHVAFVEDSLIYYTRHPSPPASPLSLSTTMKAFGVPSIAAVRDTGATGSYRRIVHVAWYDYRGNIPSVRYKRHPNNGDSGTPWDDGDTYAGNDNADISKRMSMDYAPTIWKPELDIAGTDETGTKISLVHLAWRDTRSVDGKKYDWYANSSKIFAWNDYAGGAPKPMVYADHGSEVSSAALAGVVELTSANANYNPFMGTAYNAVLAMAHDGTEAQTIQAIKWAVDTIGAEVINFSAGYGATDSGATRVTQYVDWAVARGVVFSKSAGNSGPGGSTITRPGDNFNAMTVGGTLRSGGSIMPISSRGPVSNGRIKPDLVATGGDGNGSHHDSGPIAGPGGDIYLADPFPNPPNVGMYDWWEGTSFAAPHVAGLSAMLLQAHPTWTPGAVRKALSATAAAVTGAARPNNNEGWGLVQGSAANEFNPAPFPPSILPTAADFEDSSSRGAVAHLRTLIKPNGGVNTVFADLAAFGVAASLVMTDSATIAGGWHVYTAGYTVPAGTPVGMKHIRTTAFRTGAGVHDTVKAYINLYVKTAPTSIAELNLPMEFILHQNYPNPFNPTTSIRFNIPSTEHVKLTVFDLLGREVRTLVNEVRMAGYYSTTLDGSTFATGVYYYRLVAGSYVAVRKMLLMR